MPFRNRKQHYYPFAVADTEAKNHQPACHLQAQAMVGRSPERR